MRTVYDYLGRAWTYVHGTWGNEDLLEQHDTLTDLDGRYGPLVTDEGTPVEPTRYPNPQANGA